MQKTVESAFSVFDELDKNGEAWNVYPYMLKMGSQAVGKLMLGIDFGHFDSVDAQLHDMVVSLVRVLELNKRIASMGQWYASMPFGDPKRLRQLNAKVDGFMNECMDKASKGRESLELQDAALKAEHVIGMCGTGSAPCKSQADRFVQTTASAPRTSRETDCPSSS